MKKITSFLLLALSTFFMHNSAEAQGSQVYVQLDSITDGRLNVVIRDTATGNFIGFTDNSSQSNSNQMLMLDSIGNVIWSKDVHGNIGVSEIVRASDGNYIAGGTHQYSSYNRVFAWKITPQGNSVWFRDMSEGSAGSFAGLAATSDGGCVITGTSTYTKSFWIRLTGSGATAVQREIDITVGNTNQCVGVVHTADNCFVGALNVNYGAFDSDTWIYKMDTSGTLVWLRSFDAPNQNTPKKIIQASDGGFIILS
ncbi:MAG TPA: hypothetical protein VK826_14390, partial [Bacteroidia bacterium]|nr:hypothetical protein [Bacteroidia bacterium]